jgi:quercetin dioxygenase-like cupin family protein
MTENKKHSGQLEPAVAYNMADLLDYAPGAVVSRTIAKNKAGTVTLFSFDAGQELSEHATPYDAFVQVLDGRVRLTIGGQEVVAVAGEIVLMPAGVPHAVYADERFKMALIMIRDKAADN